MDKETFLEKIKQIGTLESDVDIRQALTELTDEVVPVFEKEHTLEEENNKYKEDNEKLRQANMQLFLRVGSTTPEEAQKETTGADPVKEPRKFEDLFDEKGNLK